MPLLFLLAFCASLRLRASFPAHSGAQCAAGSLSACRGPVTLCGGSAPVLSHILNAVSPPESDGARGLNCTLGAAAAAAARSRVIFSRDGLRINFFPSSANLRNSFSESRWCRAGCCPNVTDAIAFTRATVRTCAESEESVKS